MIFDWSFAFEILPDLIAGMWRTVQATLLGMLIALVLGLVFALGRRAHSRWVSWPTRAIIEFVRSTPLLVQLIFIFYVLPDLGIVLGALTSLVIGLGIHYGTYCSEAYRAGIESVPKGQWEAATALNLSTPTTWRSVILPQAIPTAIPALGNYFVAMFKDAPLGFAITFTGIMAAAGRISSNSFQPLEAYTMTGLLFLAVSIPAALFARSLERRYGYQR
jgi:polar amino acid transport system permease protein